MNYLRAARNPKSLRFHHLPTTWSGDQREMARARWWLAIVHGQVRGDRNGRAAVRRPAEIRTGRGREDRGGYGAFHSSEIPWVFSAFGASPERRIQAADFKVLDQLHQGRKSERLRVDVLAGVRIG